MSQIFACSLSDQLIEFAGADKKSYLHGQITQDINLINHETMLWAGHCSGKGKLWAVHKLFAHNDSYFSITSADSFEQSLAELKKYAVFAKVTISHNTEFKLIGLFSDNLQPALAALNINFQGNSAAFQFGHAIKLSDDRIILIVKDTPESFLNDIAIWLDNDFTWQSLAILHGEPSLNTSAVGEYVPQMVNLQAIGGISFTKGCYTGQETVARMKYLGKNKRAMYIIQAQGDSPINSDEVEQQLGENWRRAGHIIASAFDPIDKKAVALVVLPNDISPETPLRSKHEQPMLFTIQPLPYSLSDN